MNLVPTRISFLASLGLLAGSCGWAVARLWSTWFGHSLPVHWLTAATMCVVALTLFVWAIMVKPRIQPEPGKPRVHPLVAARTAALAMSASRMGALVAGFYLGVLLVNLSSWNSPASRDRVIVCAVTVLLSIVTCAIAMWIERMCQLPKPPANASTSNTGLSV